jgi:hypothetical protein
MRYLFVVVVILMVASNAFAGLGDAYRASSEQLFADPCEDVERTCSRITGNMVYVSD